MRFTCFKKKLKVYSTTNPVLHNDLYIGSSTSSSSPLSNHRPVNNSLNSSHDKNMSNQWNKFVLLMWKNWTLLRRRPIHTAFEIIYPVLICLILVAVRGLINVEDQPDSSYNPFPTSSERLPSIFCGRLNKGGRIAYSPSSPLIDKIASNFCGNSSNNIPFDSASELNYAIDNNRSIAESIAAAFVFSDNMAGRADTSDLPSDISVYIRLPTVIDSTKQEWYTNFMYPQFQVPGPRSFNESNAKYGGDPNYYDRGFLWIQEVIALGLMNNGTAESTVDIKLQRYPYPKWVQDFLYANSMETMMSLMIMMAFMYNYVNTIRAIATEKEKQLKESMKVMGLPGWLHWMAWFLRSFIILFIAIVLIVIVLLASLNKAPVFTHSDWSVMFIFLILYACSSITFTFLISVFFSKANTATAVGSLVFFIAYLPYTLQQQATEISVSAALGSSLLSNSALSFGLSVILKFEAVEEGIHWSNLFSTTSPDNNLTLGAVMLIIILDIFLYLGIALYVEAVFPGEFGVPQPWYYLFTRAYWCNDSPPLESNIESRNKGEYFEEFTEKLPVGIQLQNLSKTFGSNKAVKQLNMDMYEGHITVLLGHNGAGKTTTMSMITGMFPPTSGTAVVSGYDVRTSIQSVRDSMGICLQHNVLFDNLTVYEHLYFFGKLKGLQANEIDHEINNYLSLLELEDKRNARSNTLSGGMKRKLSVGMALCGNSKVVMLDEPTAGMDPSARRAIWNLLQRQKEGRSILLTTHFMDEADLLGDRIAIMTGGELQCCGSSFFLKKKYGAGYYLIMDVAPECRPERVTNLLRKYIPYVQIQAHVGSELTYQLSEQESSKFEPMLHDLETNIHTLGVRSYGVSLTTLEEVFMKVGADHDNEISKMYNNNNNQNGNGKHHDKITIESDNQFGTSFLNGLPLIKNQFVAMFLKKCISIIRTWYLLALQIILPVALLIITVMNARSYVAKTTFSSLEMTLDKYNEPITLLEGNDHPYTTIYESLTKKYGLTKVSNVSATVLTETIASAAYVKMHYAVGASFEDGLAIGWFNGDPYHSTALSLSLVLNTIYRNVLKEEKSIHFYNHPLPLTLESQLDDLQFNLMGFQIASELGYGMAFVASFYVLFYIKERVSKSKHLQFVSGVNVFTFWGTSFLIDLGTYLLTMCAILITMAALQEDGFSTGEQLGRVTLVLVYFGFFMLPFVYLLSYLFSIPSSGFSRIMLIGAVAAIVGITTMQILELESLDLMYVARPLHWILLFLPFYTIAKGVYDLATIYQLRKICGLDENACSFNSMCCDINDYYSMGTPGIGRNIIISFLMSFLLLALLIFNEYGLFSFLMNKIMNYNKPPVQDDELEEDVQNEKRKIRETSPAILNNEYCLVLRDVTKYYKNFLAVNGLCLGVKPFECFGLLGVNGAGKTTTFKMMTGDEQISYGDAWVDALNIKTEQKKVQKLIGYCPQFDALLDDLTARETLKIFALIRGVPMNECNFLGEKLAHEFDFFKHLDKQVKQLSGGNKRKLSTALALIGDPPIIYLDEPTTGMDPATKRFLWTALAKLRDSGKCIVLTSHSMEECEALCTRLAIMVNGNFKCLGSTQRLKNKFAQGYSLTIKTKKMPDHSNLDNEISLIDHFIQKNFPGAQLKEKYQELLTYQLVDNKLPWSRMFGILERSKQQLNIEDYSLGQCSLEQVFLSFTKYQLDSGE